MRKGESMDYRKNPWLILVSVLVALLLASCSSNNAPDQGHNEGQLENQNHYQPSVQGEKEKSPLEKLDLREAQETAQRLAQLATQIKDVKDATAVVLGPWAVVGIDVDAKEDRGRIDVIKYSVAEALKEDPAGTYAVVTADPDMLQRLREMRTAIEEGRGLEGIMEELADMVGRLIPQPPRKSETPSQQKEHVDKVKEKQDMEQFEKEQER